MTGRTMWCHRHGSEPGLTRPQAEAWRVPVALCSKHNRMEEIRPRAHTWPRMCVGSAPSTHVDYARSICSLPSTIGGNLWHVQGINMLWCHSPTF